MRVGVLASGEGTNLQALIDGVHGEGVEIVGVATDRPGAPALGRASSAAIATACFPLDAHPDRATRDSAIADWLDSMDIELVVLAGYMALLHPVFVDRYEGRLVNVHPSLLPAFPGIRAIEQALAYGVKIFGVTVHLVDHGVDTGPVLLQRAIELPDADTADAVHAALQPIEHELLCAAVGALASGALRPDPKHPRRWVSE